VPFYIIDFRERFFNSVGVQHNRTIENEDTIPATDGDTADRLCVKLYWMR